ncbi:hypothetical protein XENORESO_009879 [Xenotaenia resolanae]|uniref:Uncharacterized protein n=1 Tax=Xenotaenia resolanae TaxID=208358 RepID=A0ABV0X3G2_9TELE
MAAINRPLPTHSEPDGRNPNFRCNSGAASSVQQDPGPHSAGQDPGFALHPQHPIFGRPVLYIHAPPPPPLLHYQWPMPFSYNPFAGFPNMGYGMIVPPPPLPPPPYMDAPGYVLPHPHVQPVDYRRLHHPLSHTQGSSHQNPNQTRRIRPNYFIPVRETVNSEVQTEPAQSGIRGYDLGSDSGRGTCSNSPSSPVLSSPKQTLTKVVNSKSPCREENDLDPDEPCTDAAVKTVESCGSTKQDKRMKKDLPDHVPIPDSLSKDGNCSLWLSDSPDGVVPVSSSSQKDDVVLKERRISVPDILMNWGGSTPQTASLKVTDVKLSLPDDQPSYKHVVERKESLCHSSTETNAGSLVGVCTGITDDMDCPKVNEMLFRILRLPYPRIDTFLECGTHEEPVEVSFSERGSLTLIDEEHYLQNSSHISSADVQENDIRTYLQEISDVAPHMSASSCQGKRKLNESIWSVESLSPFIPSREWLVQSGMVEPKVNDVVEEAENVGLSNKNEKMVNKERSGWSLSSCVSVQMSESSLCSSVQEEEQSPVRETGTEIEKVVSEPMEPEQSQSILHSDNVLSPSSALPSKAISTPTEKDENENGSSEPEASQSPNQKSLILKELRRKSFSSSSEEMFLNSAAEEIASSAVKLISQNGVDTEDNGAPVMIQNMAEVSSSKGTLVDCGVQCNEFHEQRCLCGKMIKSAESNRRHHFKSSDMKKANDGRNGHMQKKKNSQWRSTGQEGQFKQQEAHSGYCRGGKSKGGRHPRYY